MSNNGPDLERMMQQDVERVQELNQVNVRDLDPGTIIEYACWGFGLLPMAGMVIALPWVGEDALIPGHVWLAGMIIPLLFFGLLALGVRYLRTSMTEDEHQLRGRPSRRGR